MVFRARPTSSTTRESSRRNATLRELIRTSQSILHSALHPERPTDELIDEAEKAIFGVAEQRLGSGFIPISESAEKSLRWIEELTERQELITGVACGFPQFDEMTAGLQPSDLIILAARPSMGKTALALNICSHAALQQHKVVGIFSLEMSHQQLFVRYAIDSGWCNGSGAGPCQRGVVHHARGDDVRGYLEAGGTLRQGPGGRAV